MLRLTPFLLLFLIAACKRQTPTLNTKRVGDASQTQSTSTDKIGLSQVEKTLLAEILTRIQVPDNFVNGRHSYTADIHSPTSSTEWRANNGAQFFPLIDTEISGIMALFQAHKLPTQNSAYRFRSSYGTLGESPRWEVSEVSGLNPSPSQGSATASNARTLAENADIGQVNLSNGAVETLQGYVGMKYLAKPEYMNTVLSGTGSFLTALNSGTFRSEADQIFSRIDAIATQTKITSGKILEGSTVTVTKGSVEATLLIQFPADNLPATDPNRVLNSVTLKLGTDGSVLNATPAPPPPQ